MQRSKRHYYYHRSRGLACVRRGEFVKAEEHFSASYDYAEASGSDYLRDIAVCNIAACRIERGIHDDEKVSELKAMFLRTSHPKVARLATYHLARMYEIQADFKKALFYARIALDKSRFLNNREYLASSLNQTANLLVAESHFDRAAELYREALDLLNEESKSVRFALILDNWGYCRMMQEEVEEGIAAVEEANAILKERDAGGAYRVYPEMDLAYGYLEVGRNEKARSHGETALRMARENDRSSLIKNILLLLGDSNLNLENIDEARSYYGELAAHYPSVTTASDFLLAFSIRKVVNLRL